MKREDFKWNAPNGLSLQGRFWKASEEPIATLIGVHGYSEYSLQYEPLVDFLLRKNFDILWFDLPGHGESAGRRSSISRFEDYHECLESFIQETKRMRRSENLKLFGHSLGGLVCIRFLETSQYSGLFSSVGLSSPLLGLPMSGFVFGIVKCLTHLLPNLTLPNEGSLGGDILTHDPERRKRRLADPLIKSQVTIHWVREFIRARRLAFSEIGKISRPLGIFQAGDDKVVSRVDSEKFFHLLNVQKKLRIYEGWYHELSNEIDRSIFFEELFQWYQR